MWRLPVEKQVKKEALGHFLSYLNQAYFWCQSMALHTAQTHIQRSHQCKAK